MPLSGVFQGDPLGHTAAEEYELAVRALGAVIWWVGEKCLVFELFWIIQLKYVFAVYIIPW